MKRKKGSAPGKKTKKFIGPRPRDYQAGRELARPTMREKKAFDVALTNLNFNVPATPPVFQVLNACINGAELYQRVGRKIYMKSIHIRGFIQPIATSISDIGRLIIFYDAQPNAAAPLIATLLQDSTAAAATSSLSEINLINRARFKILRDYQVLLPSQTDTAGVITNLANFDPIGPNTLNVNFFIPLKGLETEYNGVNGGTIADISSGAIFITAVSQNATSEYEFTYTCRMRYYD